MDVVVVGGHLPRPMEGNGATPIFKSLQNCQFHQRLESLEHFNVLYMPRDNRCMYMVHVCFYVCCSNCVGVCGNVCCVVAIVKEVCFEPWSVEVCCMFV